MQTEVVVVKMGREGPQEVAPEVHQIPLAMPVHAECLIHPSFIEWQVRCRPEEQI
jgi:hypothetical protein